MEQQANGQCYEQTEQTMSKQSAAAGYFGSFGGQFSPEILYEVLQELNCAFMDAQKDPSFWQDFVAELSSYSCRPTPITLAKNLTQLFGGARIFIKREDLNHTGAHKLNNVVGQALLAKRLGKKTLIAETGAGQHGFATATVAARLGLNCRVYMGQIDALRQRPNVFWMEKLGAQVIEVDQGSRTLKEAINEAFRDWSTNFQDSYYLLGTACGPHPFPAMVTWFQSIIGQEARQQMIEQYQTLPDKVYACVGGGSNAMGIFQGFLPEKWFHAMKLKAPSNLHLYPSDPQQASKQTELVGVEAGGDNFEPQRHAMRIAQNFGKVGIAQGYKTFFLSNDDGQMLDTHSIAAGLDYVGVSPILAYLASEQAVRFEAASDQEVLQAVQQTMHHEGLIPALESAHAFVQAFREVSQLSSDQSVLINLSGRGDKDIFNFGDAFQDAKWIQFLQDKKIVC